ncbi:HD domain-containing protein [Aneurinibacillus aneurinilyticus]|uniref:HD domain-containing protein n=2 Tax=Aneurinibacillus aneurinilyticus TaxID=1391 RepID=A0A848D445_ANEAE|nr:HD domain-containing protein [Aneurinibacillus aneurinilyticus]
MDLYSVLLILGIGIAANLDNAGAGFAYGVRKIQIPWAYNFIIAFMAFLLAIGGGIFGNWISYWFTPFMCNLIGIIVLVSIGVWVLCQPDRFERNTLSEKRNNITIRISKVLYHAKEADSGQSKSMSIGESIILGIALSINNLAGGFNVGITHLNIWLASIISGVFSYICVGLCAYIGSQFAAEKLGKQATIISGILMILIGLHQMLSFTVTINYDFETTGDAKITFQIIQWLMYILVVVVISTLIKSYMKEKENSLNLILTLAKSLDSRDKYTECHSERVAYYSLLIAKEMRLPKKQLKHLYTGGIIHDIGKIGVPESILTKPSRLTDDEYEIIKQHPTIGYEMVKHIPSFQKNGVLDMILYHHEKFDGTGYPKGLKGEQIPLVARIMAVADAFDAMTSRRVYRSEADFEYAINEIRKNRGTQFDPEVSDAFLRILEIEEKNILSVVSQIK